MSVTKPSAKRNFIQAVIALNPGITRREIAGVIGEPDAAKRIEHLLRRLVINGSVIAHQLEHRGAERAYYSHADAHLVPVADVFEECRANWAGYIIHKIFGAGGRVRIGSEGELLDNAG